MKKPDASNQPIRQCWMLTKLAQAHAMALANSVDLSTQHSYGSALNSWLAFVDLHEFPFEPTLETLSYFIVYMSHHINPRSVKCYLSGLVQQLEPDYPSIRDLRNSRHITKVMRGCLKMNTKAISQKSALSLDDVRLICDRIKHSVSHDDLLFMAMLSTVVMCRLRFPGPSWLCQAISSPSHRKPSLRLHAAHGSGINFQKPGAAAQAAALGG